MIKTDVCEKRGGLGVGEGKSGLDDEREKQRRIIVY